MTEQGWKRLWQSYMQDFNVKYGYDGKQSKNRPGGLPMVIDTFTTHQLRHTFCTLMYFSGVDVLTARDQMGHKEDQPSGRISQSGNRLNQSYFLRHFLRH